MFRLSSSSAFPAIVLGFTILSEIFAYVTVLFIYLFFNSTIEVVTFRLRGWCVLGVFLLPEFTLLGHGWLDLWSPCDGMHVFTDFYTRNRKRFREMEPEPMLTPREKSSLPEAQRRIEPMTLHHAGRRAQHTTD